MILDSKYPRESFKNVDRDFSVLYVGYALNREFDKAFNFQGERHNFTEIVYVETGSVEVIEDERVYLMNGGDIIFHAPMEFHRIKSDKGSSPKVYNLSVGLSGALPENLYRGVFHLDSSMREQFKEIFALAKSFLEEEGEAQIGCEMGETLALFIRRICRENNMTNKLIFSSGAKIYKELVEYMQTNVCNNVGLEEVAKENHVSVSYVKMLFARYANVSPKIYYMKLRAAEAARLLSIGVPSAEIAERMNFSSAAYFTAFFKRMTGVNPSAYQKDLK